MIDISFKGVKKIYPKGNNALDGLDLDIKRSEFLTIIGPSGCGKTTLLKMINGLVIPTEGEILIDGRNIEELDIIALRRKIGYVIQQIGLFPHLNIEKNIAYVLKLNGIEASKRRKRAEELLELVGLHKGILEKYPRQLSGGEQQRIGVIRALAADPPIILMDEPFGAIDEKTRSSLQDELLNIQAKLKKTIVFVTHDIDEAMKLGDRIAVINKGKLEQVESPKKIFFKPKNEFVMNFFGLKSFSSFMNTTNVMEGLDQNYSHIVFHGEDGMSNLNSEKYDGDKIPVVDNCGRYLGVVGVLEEHLEYEDIQYRKAITSNSTMMESIEMLFKEGIHSTPVIDENNRYLGVFSLDKGYRKILKSL